MKAVFESKPFPNSFETAIKADSAKRWEAYKTLQKCNKIKLASSNASASIAYK